MTTSKTSQSQFAPIRIAACIAAAACVALTPACSALAGEPESRAEAPDATANGMSEAQRKLFDEINQRMDIQGSKDRDLGDDSEHPRVPRVPPSGIGDSGQEGGRNAPGLTHK